MTVGNGEWTRPNCPIGHGDTMYVYKSWLKSADPVAFEQAIEALLWMVGTDDWWDGVVSIWRCTECRALKFHAWRFGDAGHVAGYRSIARGIIE